MNNASATLPKQERLSRKNLFGALFKAGKKAYHFPVLMIYLPAELPEPVRVQAGFSASKRKFKKAVDRNRLKRQMREAYRQQKAPYLTNLHAQYAVMFVYIHHKPLPYQQIARAIGLCLHSLANQETKD